jgi:hypothetical protein
MRREQYLKIRLCLLPALYCSALLTVISALYPSVLMAVACKARSNSLNHGSAKVLNRRHSQEQARKHSGREAESRGEGCGPRR